MKDSLRIAAAQFPVSQDISRNARYIKAQMQQAAAKGSQVIQFPETALSGYAPKHIASFQTYDWNLLERYTKEICALALSLNLWVILGSTRQVKGSLPRNCVQVISHKGLIVAVYDKQRLYAEEKTFYSSGHEPLIIEINGFKCGVLICFDNCFPALYEPYRAEGVGLLFHCFYNAGNRGASSIKDLLLANLLIRAADNQMWISASNSSEPYSPLAACVVRPDGSLVKTKRNITGFIMDDYPNTKLGWTYDNRKT